MPNLVIGADQLPSDPSIPTMVGSLRSRPTSAFVGVVIRVLLSRVPHSTTVDIDRQVKNLDFTTEGGCAILAS